MHFIYEFIPEQHIVYIRRTGGYGNDNKPLMEQMKNWAKKHSLITDSSVFLGVPQDDPNTTLPENCIPVV